VTGTNGGRAGFVPNAEAVDEVRIETSPYDASMGHAIGSFISATVKSGTNGLHGAGFWQFQQFRWNAAPHFTRLNYQQGLANGSIKAGTPEQASGRVTTRASRGRTSVDPQGDQRQEQAVLLYLIQQTGEHRSS